MEQHVADISFYRCFLLCSVPLTEKKKNPQLQCCGVNTFHEWDNNTFGLAGGDVPDGCCRTKVEGCGRGVLLRLDATTPVNATEAEITIIHPRGCYSAVRGQLARGAPAFIACFVTFLLIQVSET